MIKAKKNVRNSAKRVVACFLIAALATPVLPSLKVRAAETLVSLGSHRSTEIPSDSWVLDWSDEFDGNAVDESKWGYNLGNCIVDSKGTIVSTGWGNNEKQNYIKDNATVDNGNLVITAKKEDTVDPHGIPTAYTSSKLVTKATHGQKYGKIAIRAKMPIGQGLWPAIWMLPKNDVYGGWASSGEIDIMEGRGSKPLEAYGTLHYGGDFASGSNTYSGKTYHFTEGNGTDQFHDYSIEWEPGEIRFYVDGNLYQVQNNWYTTGVGRQEKYSFPAPFDQDFYMILNLAVGGNYDGEPDANTTFPAQMQVDYVRMYHLDTDKTPALTPIEPSVDKDNIPTESIPADGNYIRDNQYAQGFDKVVTGAEPTTKPWGLYTINQFGGVADVTTETLSNNGVDSNFAKVAISNQGTQAYSVQMIQYLPIYKGQTYKVSFDAKAEADRTMGVTVGAGGDRGYEKYYTDNAALTTEIKHYEYIFTMPSATNTNARLELNMGLNPSSIWVGNVKIETTVPKALDENAPRMPLGDGNLVYNGTFDRGNVDRLTYWSVNDAAKATITVPEDTRELNIGTTATTDVKDAFVKQTGLYLQAAGKYKLTFSARSTVNKDIKVALINKDNTVNYESDKVASLTSDTQNFSYDFTLGDNGTDPTGTLAFYVGGSEDSTVYLDNVKLIRTDGTVDLTGVDLNPLQNGYFAKGTDKWESFFLEGGQGGFTVDKDGVAQMNIKATGNQSWSNMLVQGNLNLKKGVEYLVSFDAKSSIPRTMGVDLENVGYWRMFDKTVDLTTDMKRYTFSFEATSSEVFSMKFFLGQFGSDVIAEHNVSIDNVFVEVKNPNTNLVKNGKFVDGDNGWTLWSNQGTSFDTSGENVVATVNSIGTDFWNNQAVNGDFTLEKGKSYRVTLDASSTVDRPIAVYVENKATYAKLPNEQVGITNLTKDNSTYTYEFTMTGDTINTAHLVIGLGKVAGIDPAIAPHTITLDNVFINEIPAIETGSTPVDPPIVQTPGQVLLDQNFDDNVTGDWGIYNDGVPAPVLTAENGALKVTVPQPSVNSWIPQIFKTGFALVKDTKYILSFKAKATTPRKLQMNVGQFLNQDPWFIQYAPVKQFGLGNEYQQYTYEFTVTNDTTKNGKFTLEFGQIEGDAGSIVPNEFYFDDIKLQVAPAVVKDTYVTLNAISNTLNGQNITIGGTSDFDKVNVKVVDSASKELMNSDVTVADNNYSTNYTLPTNATAGTYTVTVTAGSIVKTTTFVVTVKNTFISLSTIGNTYNGSKIEINGSSNFDKVKVQVVDNKNKVLTTQYVNVVNGKYSSTYTLSKNATAGTYKVVVSAGNVTVTKTFKVTVKDTYVILDPVSKTKRGHYVSIHGKSDFSTVTIVIKNSKNKVIAKKVVKVTNGKYSYRYKISSRAYTGTYKVIVTAGSKSATRSFKVYR